MENDLGANFINLFRLKDFVSAFPRDFVWL